MITEETGEDDVTSDSYTCSGTGGVVILECRVTSKATIRERERECGERKVEGEGGRGRRRTERENGGKDRE